MRLPALVLLLMVLATAAALAAAKPRPAKVEAVEVAAVLDGRTLALADGRQLRLVGLMLPTGADGASSALAAAVPAGGTVEVEPVGEGVDRHGRLVGLVRLADGTDLHEVLLRQGAVLIQGNDLPAGHLARLRNAEAAARSTGVGLWSGASFPVRTADEVSAEEGEFRVVSGTVQRVARVGDWIFLNFGRDWRADFTVEIARRDLRAFVRAGLDPVTLEGRRVEVRGWVEDRNGPAIRAAEPGQIEILPPSP